MANSSDNFSNAILKLLVLNEDLTGIGDAAGLLPSAAAGNLYLRLCTDAVVANKTTLGTECAYTGYVAKGVAVPRSSGGWTVTGNQFKNAATVLFGARTAGTENIRYVEVWKNNTSSNIADRIAFVQLTADLLISDGSQPKFDAEALVFTFE